MTTPSHQNGALIPCQECALTQAKQLAKLALDRAALTAAASLPPALTHMNTTLKPLLARAAAMASQHQWQEAALWARDANDALANAILEHYAVPGKPSTVEMPLSAARASQTLTNVTIALVSLALTGNTTDSDEPTKAAEAAQLALANDPSLQTQAQQILSAACTHP